MPSGKILTRDRKIKCIEEFTSLIKEGLDQFLKGEDTNALWDLFINSFTDSVYGQDFDPISLVQQIITNPMVAEREFSGIFTKVSPKWEVSLNGKVLEAPNNREVVKVLLNAVDPTDFYNICKKLNNTKYLDLFSKQQNKTTFIKLNNDMYFDATFNGQMPVTNLTPLIKWIQNNVNPKISFRILNEEKLQESLTKYYEVTGRNKLQSKKK